MPRGAPRDLRSMCTLSLFRAVRTHCRVIPAFAGISVQATQEENSPRCIMMTKRNSRRRKNDYGMQSCHLTRAGGEKQRLLVNADLRRPAIHELFGLTQQAVASFSDRRCES